MRLNHPLSMTFSHYFGFCLLTIFSSASKVTQTHTDNIVPNIHLFNNIIYS